MSDLNLLDTDIEADLRSSVRSLLHGRCDPLDIVGLYDGGPGPVGLAEALGTDMGLAALLVPEEFGGAGASAREAAVVLEETGRAVAPVPFLTSSVIATTVLVRARSSLLTELAQGRLSAAVALPFSTGPTEAPSGVSVEHGRLRGRIQSVAGAAAADLLLVPVAVNDGIDIYAVRAHEATVTPVVSLDMSRPVADITLENTHGDLVVSGAAGANALRTALLTGAALLASEQAGIAQWCLDTTLVHLKERRQFGRIIGGFQAVKHRMADLFVEVESAVAIARYAAAATAAGDDVEVATAMAQAFCSDVAVRAAEEALQLHAGIGMTWEHPIHLYLKRAKADQIALGSPGHHRAVLAGLIDLPAAGSPS